MRDEFQPYFDPTQDALPDTVDPHRLQVLVETLTKTTFQAGEHRRVYKVMPRTPSQASSEMQEGAGISEDFTSLAYGIPSLLIATAEDHLNCLRLAIQRAGMYGAAALARSVLEASARAWWHFDSGIDVRERIRRAVAEYLRDCWEYLQLERQ